MPIRLSSTRLDLGSASLTNAELRGWSETVNALGNVTGATTVDLTLGNVVTATTTGATTWTITNASSSNTSSFTLILTNGGSQTQTWMSGTQWANGTSPSLTSSGTDVLTFFTTDAGTTWRASKGGPTPSEQTGQKLFVWGSGEGGASGLGDTTHRSSPVQLVGQWKSGPRNTGHSGAGAFLRSDGSLFVWGENSAGNLGLSDTINRSSPVQLGGTWVKTNALYRTFALTASGALWGSGHNSLGQLGLGDNIHRSSPVQTPGTWSDFANSGHTLAIRPDGSLWGWGANDSGQGQFGVGDTIRRSSPVQILGTWLKISVGSTSSFGIRSDGSLWSWGANTHGVLGLGDGYNRSSPLQIPGTWSHIAAGSTSALAIRHDGTLWGWGQNASGQLGLGNTILRSSPGQIGSGVWSQASTSNNGVSSILSAAGVRFAFGLNYRGRLGLGDTMYRSSPVQSAGTWSGIFTGGESSFGFKF